jgi:DNA uptake protein ComE-like DNA-binding protein
MVLTALLCTSLAALHGGAIQARHQAKTSSTSPEARVDINFASMEDLLKVPGMTHTWAARIIRFRPYHTKGDLVARGVLTSEAYSRIKDDIIAHREKQ